MGIYRCNRCELFFDDDTDPCAEDPADELELLCPECAEQLSMDYELNVKLDELTRISSHECPEP